MQETSLTSERIIEAAEEVLRRFGPAKANVLDVARTLGVSHGSVYRHFPSKAALRDAVAQRWLVRISEPLAAIATSAEPPLKRLERWFGALITAKRERAQSDPALFAAYVELTNESRDVIQAHIAELIRQVTVIVAAGSADGSIVAADPAVTARALFYATTRFHNPIHASQWADPEIDMRFAEIWHLLLAGILPRS
jgi:AcrR family transcriptional regulator